MKYRIRHIEDKGYVVEIRKWFQWWAINGEGLLFEPGRDDITTVVEETHKEAEKRLGEYDLARVSWGIGI